MSVVHPCLRVRIVYDDAASAGPWETAIQRSRAEAVAFVARNGVGERLTIDDRVVVCAVEQGGGHSGLGLRIGNASYRAIVPSRLVQRSFPSESWQLHFIHLIL